MMILREFSLHIAWLISLVATVGSLFFSDVMQLPPCKLCWIQRIFMYPLVPILAAGLLFSDKKVIRYAIPLTILGLLIAVYHNLLYYQIIPDSLKPCTEGVSCTSKQIEWLGFITIPLLSLVAFFLLNTFLLLFNNLSSTKERPL